MLYDLLGTLRASTFRARNYLFRAHGGCGKLILQL
jgi:hypothetical protein